MSTVWRAPWTGWWIIPAKPERWERGEGRGWRSTTCTTSSACTKPCTGEPWRARMRVSLMRVLVTYGWCRTAYAICASLARAGFRVSACGDSALCMTRISRYVDTFDRVPNPFESPREYAAAVGRIVRKRAVDLVVPAHEDFVAL